MRKILKENILVVCTIAVCFSLTLSLCLVFSGGAIDVFKAQNVSAQTFYAVAVGGYSDIVIARESADLIKKRGGAGYVQIGDEIEIFYAIYRTESDAKSVLQKLDDKSAYIKKLDIASGKFSWCEKTYKECVKKALSYFDLTFDTLYDVASSLNSNTIGLDDAKTQIRVLYNQIEDIKSAFYNDIRDCNAQQVTQIKLSLVTALALFDNIKFDSGVATAAASVRYQLVQVVLLRQTLMAQL